MNMKRLLLFICTLLCANVIMAQTFWEDNLRYAIVGTGIVEVVDFNNDSYVVNIPSSVTHTWGHYEENEDGTALEFITDSIGTYAVTSIGYAAFYNCSSLASVTIPNSVISIGYGAFSNCYSLTSVNIPNSVTSIGEWAFEVCISLTSITIPNSVTSIGRSAFYNCSSLASVTIPNSVISISEWTFERCISLTSVTIPNSVTSIEYGAFMDCSSLTSVTIPNSVTSIGEFAFTRCSSLSSVNIGNSVTSLNEGVFDSCINLTSVNIPNSITSIGRAAFEECYSLTSVTIPNSVTSIGYGAFANCSSLTSVTTLATNPPLLGDYAFYDICSPSTLYPPEGYSDEYINSDWKDWFDCIVLDTTINATIMQGETYNFNGQELSEEGVYNATVLSVLGCEINLTVNLDVIPNNYTNGETSSLQETELEEIVFYPNPTKGLISFSKTIEKIEVVDISGKILLSFSNVREINIGDLPEGSYLLRLHSNENSVLRKIVKE